MMKTSAQSLAALTLGVMAASSVGFAHAQPGEAKATVDAAKAQGAAGEQADGFVGLVAGEGSPALRAAMDEINAGRAKAYREAAARSGVTTEAAAQATGRQLEGRLPPGQYFRTADGRWERR